MANENNTRLGSTEATDLKVPTPPQQVKQNEGSSAGQTVEATPSEETVINNNPDTEPNEKVQDYDWNNGKPEVTKEFTPKLDAHKDEAHKTADQRNDEDLRKNKGNEEGQPVLEASEEVNTGQNSG